MKWSKAVEVVADDIVVVRFGVLQHYKERNLKLNDKVRLRLPEVPMWRWQKGRLCIDPNKAQAILEMPPPEDTAAVGRLLSDVTKPLGDLTKQEIVLTFQNFCLYLAHKSQMT